MKNNINIILIGLIVCLSGCSILHKNGVIGRAVKKTDRIVAKIQTTKDYQFINMDEKLTKIGELSYGTEYALSKVTNKEPAVSVAKQFNQRVESLANKPNLKESEAVKVLAELLITNSIEGSKALAVKDIEIISLQATSDKLKIEKDKEIASMIKQADYTAGLADTLQASLDQYKGWFGLKAVAMGLWQFAKTSVWVIGGLGLVFFILRFAASGSPLAAVIFSVFEKILSYGITTIVSLAPKAITFAGYIKDEVVKEVPIIVTKIENELANTTGSIPPKG